MRIFQFREPNWVELPKNGHIDFNPPTVVLIAHDEIESSRQALRERGFKDELELAMMPASAPVVSRDHDYYRSNRNWWQDKPRFSIRLPEIGLVLADTFMTVPEMLDRAARDVVLGPYAPGFELTLSGSLMVVVTRYATERPIALKPEGDDQLAAAAARFMEEACSVGTLVEDARNVSRAVMNDFMNDRSNAGLSECVRVQRLTKLIRMRLGRHLSLVRGMSGFVKDLVSAKLLRESTAEQWLGPYASAQEQLSDMISQVDAISAVHSSIIESEVALGDAHRSAVADRFMRFATIVASIAIPVTLWMGFWGMNLRFFDDKYEPIAVQIRTLVPWLPHGPALLLGSLGLSIVMTFMLYSVFRHVGAEGLDRHPANSWRTGVRPIREP